MNFDQPFMALTKDINALEDVRRPQYQLYSIKKILYGGVIIKYHTFLLHDCIIIIIICIATAMFTSIFQNFIKEYL